MTMRATPLPSRWLLASYLTVGRGTGGATNTIGDSGGGSSDKTCSGGATSGLLRSHREGLSPPFTAGIASRAPYFPTHPRLSDSPDFDLFVWRPARTAGRRIPRGSAPSLVCQRPLWWRAPRDRLRRRKIRGTRVERSGKRPAVQGGVPVDRVHGRLARGVASSHGRTLCGAGGACPATVVLLPLLMR